VNSSLSELQQGIRLKKICVIDGQGGGIGAAIIKKLKQVYEETVEIIALGTNAIATSQMLKARANKGATGENAIIHTVQQVDVILGPMAVILANAMMGEVTPAMAAAISGSRARKIFLPLSRENIEIVGAPDIPLPHLIDLMVDEHLKKMSL